MVLEREKDERNADLDKLASLSLRKGGFDMDKAHEASGKILGRYTVEKRTNGNIGFLRKKGPLSPEEEVLLETLKEKYKNWKPTKEIKSIKHLTIRKESPVMYLSKRRPKGVGDS